MSNYLDAIPQAVADIVTHLPNNWGGTISSAAELDSIQKRAVELTDQLTRVFVTALVEAQARVGKP